MIATSFPSQNLWPLRWKQLVFIFSLYRLSIAQDNRTTCDVPWVEPLANTSLTCHFPKNVNQPNTIFGISFESDDREKKSQDILDCGWFSGKIKCSTSRPGDKFDDIIRVPNTFSLEFPQASAAHIGTYRCYLVDINRENYKPCEFRVKVVGKTMCVISSLQSKTRTSLTCYYPEDLNKTRTNLTIYHYSRTGLTEVIMACEWKGDNLTCNTIHGYEFDDRVSDYLTLKIPMALESQQGAYSCHISSAGFLHYDNCTVMPEKVNSTCNIQSVEEAEPTTLTCKFSVDVNMIKRNFSVVHFSGADRKAVDIASCTWLRDHLTCTTVFGYQLNNTVTDHVIIRVPQASHNHSGTYACHVAGTVTTGFEPCEFVIMPVSDKASLSEFITAAIVLVMCIPLSLIIVFIILRLNILHLNKREEVKDVDERTQMLSREDDRRDQETRESRIAEDTVMIQKETVDTNQKASQEQELEIHEESSRQTSVQSGSLDKDMQPPSKGATTGNDKTQEVFDGHSPSQFDAHKEEKNQTSPQSGTLDPQPPSNGDDKTSLESRVRGKRMSVTSQKKKKGRRKKDATIKTCRLPVTDAQAALLALRGSLNIYDALEKTGAVVQCIDRKPIEEMNYVIIRGSPLQINAAVTLITQKPDNKEISAQLDKDWLQWVEAAFPKLDSRAYFLPPVYVNRVPMTTQTVAGQNVFVLQSTPGHVAAAPPPPPQMSFRVQESDIRDDAARQRVLFCLQKMFKLSGEGLFGISQLRFGDYLSEAGYAATAAQIPLPNSLPEYKPGVFDILLIHQHYGVIVCEVKSFGHNILDLNVSSDKTENNIRKKLKQCVGQLNKAEAMLSHLVSDIAPDLRITKTIAFPNLTTQQVQQAVSNDNKLTQGLQTCLRTDPNNVAGLFLTSDQLSDSKTPWDVSSDVLKKLENWWQHRVTANGPDSQMSSEIYKKLMTRFCGPATNVTVQYTSTIRHCIKTLGQAVSLTGECYSALITLFPEHIHLLSTTYSRLFVAGPPGTGKTLVLQLRSMEWLQGGDVYIVSTWVGSRAASTLLYERLLHTSPKSSVFLKKYDLNSGTDVENAVKELSEAAKAKPLMVIADEVGPDESNFQNFCKQLLDKVPNLHLWAASCYHGYSPQGWPVEYLTKSLRSPPAVVREIKQAREIQRGSVQAYSERGVPDHTDGPPVKRLYHGQDHSGDWPVDCVTCGQEVVSFLHSLFVGVVQTTSNSTANSTSDNTAPHALKWSDVLVLYHHAVSDTCGLVTALRTEGIPVQVRRIMTDDDIKDLALERRDVVWVLGGHHVCGLERKVVVCLDPDVSYGAMDFGFRLRYMSRCTSQLVIVSSTTEK